MRAFLLLLLSVFLFNATVSADKGLVSLKEGVSVSAVSTEFTANPSFIQEQISSPSQAHISISTQRTHFPVRVNAFIPAKYCPEPTPFISHENTTSGKDIDSFQGQRIGLRLLFPQHYFW